MRHVSRRFAASIGHTSNRWVTEIDWSNDGFDPDGIHGQGTARLISGTCTADATQQIRWHCELEITGAPFGVYGINPFTTQFRIRHGIQFGRERPELLAMGAYKVRTISRSRSFPGKLTLTGDSFEHYLINSRFPKIQTLPKADAKARLESLIRPVLRDAAIYWDPRVNSRVMPASRVERERWEAIDGGQDAGSVAKALGARIYTDGSGTFVVMPTPSLEDPPSWTADVGPGGVIVESTEELTDEFVYNAVVVTGESTDGTTPPVGPMIARDHDPSSLTYAWRSPTEGGFGFRPYFYTSQLITTRTQAFDVARARLAPLLGLRQQISFDSLHDPRKEPGDVGIVALPADVRTAREAMQPQTRTERVILDAVTYDLLGGPLSCQTRTTQTRLAGNPSAAPAEETEGATA